MSHPVDPGALSTYTSTMCPEKDRLLDESFSAAMEHSRKSLQLSYLAEISPEFNRLLRQVEEARNRANRAREAYQQHLNEHGC